MSNNILKIFINNTHIILLQLIKFDFLISDCSYAYGRKYYSIYSLPSPTIFPGPYNVYSKRKGGQVRFTPNQTDILEKRFMSNKYLSPEDRKRLADNLKLSDRQVTSTSFLKHI